MGIQIDLPTYILGDNQSIICNTSKLHSSLIKKPFSIAFHFFREGTNKDEWQTTYINTHSNPADLLNKSFAGGEKRSEFIGYVLHNIN